MPDIALRFHKDMLVLSPPIEPVLSRQGFDLEQGLEFASLVEPETIRDALRLSVLAGVQCVVTNTSGMTKARLAHQGMEDRSAELLDAALAAARQASPQHVLVEVGPCGLPLDASSKHSLNEHRGQYAHIARLCADRELDAIFLNGFGNPIDLKCALMGVRQASDVPVFASVDVDADGRLADGRHSFEDALDVMLDCGASVAGFATPAPLEQAALLARRACQAGELPVLAQLIVAKDDSRQGRPVPANPYYCPDVLVDASVRLRAEGVQFLRASGAATPAYAGALAIASEGLDVISCDGE